MTNEDAIGEAVRNTCILATIRCSALGLTRTDKQTSNDVTSQHGAVNGAARVVVSRLPGADEHHRQIVNAQLKMKHALYGLSMRYGNDEGWRLLPNANWQTLLMRLSEGKAEYEKVLSAFIADLPNVVARAQANKGSLNIEVPTEEELRRAYTMETEFRPIHDGRFRGLPPNVVAKLEQTAQAKLAAAIEMAKQDTLQRFVSPLEHFVERMVKYDEREQAQSQGKEVGRHGIFRDSVVGNVKELVDVVASFNVTGDERLTLLTEKVKALDLNPDALRDNQPVRQDATAKAREILADLKDWLG